MNIAILRDKLQPRTNVGLWLPIILAEICLAAIGTLFPLKPMIIILIGIPLVLYLFSKPFHAYLFAILLLPFWEVTLRGIGDVEGQMDLRYTQIATAVAVLSWLLNGLITKKLYFGKNILNFSITILIGWMLFSFFWTVNVNLGIRQFLLTLYGIGVFFLTINSVTDEKTLNIALKVWIIAGLLCALAGLFELIATTLPAVKNLPLGTITHWGDPVRISGFREGPHRLGFLLNVCLMMAVPQLIISKSRKYKLFLIFCIFSMLIVLANTMSRSTWIGCFVGIAGCSFYSKRLAKTFFISCFVVLVLFVALTPDALQHAIVERFKGVVNPLETTSIAGRANVWEAGMKMFRERPLTGMGIGSFSVLSTPYGSVHLEAPHNVYLFFLSEFGLIGLSNFLVLIFIVVTSVIKGLKYISNDANKFVLFGLFAGLIIYSTQGLVVSYKFLEMEIWALLGLTTVALKIFISQEEKIKGSLHPAENPSTKNFVQYNYENKDLTEQINEKDTT